MTSTSGPDTFTFRGGGTVPIGGLRLNMSGPFAYLQVTADGISLEVRPTCLGRWFAAPFSPGGGRVGFHATWSEIEVARCAKRSIVLNRHDGVFCRFLPGSPARIVRLAAVLAGHDVEIRPVRSTIGQTLR